MMVVVALLSCIVSKPAEVLRGAVKQLDSKQDLRQHWLHFSSVVHNVGGASLLLLP